MTVRLYLQYFVKSRHAQNDNTNLNVVAVRSIVKAGPMLCGSPTQEEGIEKLNSGIFKSANLQRQLPHEPRGSIEMGQYAELITGDHRASRSESPDI